MADDPLAALVAALSDPAQKRRLPAGMRNNNPGNIKFVGQRDQGIVGPSENTDQGDPQAVFDSPQHGMQAMVGLLRRKYTGGKRTANDIIAGQGGWTPGNFQAAANVARTAGLAPDADINFSDPGSAAKFVRGLVQQEHGQSAQLYPDSLISAALSGAPSTSIPISSQIAARPNSPPLPPGAPAPPLHTSYVKDHPIMSMAPDAPPSVMAAATPQPQQTPWDVLGQMALTAPQQPQFQPVEIRGPSPEQAQALTSFLEALKKRVA